MNSYSKETTIFTLFWFAGLASLNYIAGILIDPFMLMTTAIVSVLVIGFYKHIEANKFFVGLTTVLVYVIISILQSVGVTTLSDVLILNASLLTVNFALICNVGNYLNHNKGVHHFLDLMPQNDRVLSFSKGEELVTREFYRASRFNRNVSLVYCNLSKSTKENKVIFFNDQKDSTQSLQLMLTQNKLLQSICSLIYKDDIIVGYKDGFLVCLPESSEKDTKVFLDNLAKLIEENLKSELVAGYAVFPDEGVIFHNVAETAFNKATNWKRKDQTTADDTIYYRSGDLAVNPMRRFEIEQQTQWLNNIQTNTLSAQRRQERIKRMFDVTLTLALLPLILPTMVVIAILIKLDDGGSIIYRQKRTGFNGERFEMFKFRTMKPNAKSVAPKTIEVNGVTQYIWPEKNDNDNRITRVGHILRKTSLDEVPQLLNILNGDMTFVGPRPTSWDLDKYTSHQKNRLTVRPGITGLWQVSARDATNFDERLIWDTKYIEKMNIWLDFRILFMTFTAVIKRKGA